jgi:hypothetical protein
MSFAEAGGPEKALRRKFSAPDLFYRVGARYSLDASGADAGDHPQRVRLVALDNARFQLYTEHHAGFTQLFLTT